VPQRRAGLARQVAAVAILTTFGDTVSAHIIRPPAIGSTPVTSRCVAVVAGLAAADDAVTTNVGRTVTGRITGARTIVVSAVVTGLAAFGDVVSAHIVGTRAVSGTAVTVIRPPVVTTFAAFCNVVATNIVGTRAVSGTAVAAARVVVVTILPTLGNPVTAHIV
jgi:hypothetical protein